MMERKLDKEATILYSNETESEVRRMDANKKNEIPIHVDIAELDCAIEKASRLRELLLEVQSLIHSLSRG